MVFSPSGVRSVTSAIGNSAKFISSLAEKPNEAGVASGVMCPSSERSIGRICTLFCQEESRNRRVVVFYLVLFKLKSYHEKNRLIVRTYAEFPAPYNVESCPI